MRNLVEYPIEISDVKSTLACLYRTQVTKEMIGDLTPLILQNLIRMVNEGKITEKDFCIR